MTFLIISIVTFNGIAFFMKKRISKIEIYASSLFALFIEYIANYIFDFIQKLYGYFGPGTNLITFVVVIGIYPAVNTIFLNYFPYKSKTSIKLAYILGCSVFSVFYEYLTCKSKFFYHNSWNLWLSSISYPIIFVLILLNFKLIRSLNR